MPTVTEVTIALLAAGCFTTGFRAWRWQRRELARIHEYRERLKLRIDRGDEDLQYAFALLSARMGLTVEEIRRPRQVEGDALLGQMTGLHVVRDGVA